MQRENVFALRVHIAYDKRRLGRKKTKMNKENGDGHPLENKRSDSLEEMYVKLILQGKRYFAEVPDNIKEEIRRLLIEQGREDLLEE